VSCAAGTGAPRDVASQGRTPGTGTRTGTNSDAAPVSRDGVNPEIEEAEATGIASLPSANGLFVPRFVPVRTDPLFAGDAIPPVSKPRGKPSRYASRTRRLTSDEESAIVALAGTRSLRAIGADFAVSHETVRAVLRRAPGGNVPAGG
jgi:hypothetical protein